MQDKSIKRAQDELQLRKKFMADFPFYARHCLTITKKDGEGSSVGKLVLNDAQTYINHRIDDQLKRTGKVRIITLKGRQQGISTYTEGRFYWRVTHSKGRKAFILTHDNDATSNLYAMVKRYHDHCPQFVRPNIGVLNAKELNFPNLDSGYKIGTAGNKGVGRSSTIHYFHGSEVAQWANAEEHAAGILQAVPKTSGTEVIFESTAKGQGNYFHLMWQLAESKESDFESVFIPWYWQRDYRRRIDGEFIKTEEEAELSLLYNLDDEQLSWRRNEIKVLAASGVKGEALFKQEYPFNPIEAFLATAQKAFIESIDVEKARRNKLQQDGPIVIGVDPAYKGEFSKDNTAIINRQGRRAYDLTVVHGYDTMQITGLVVDRINKINPSKIFVDSVGIGVGIIDRLRELGYGALVMPIYSQAKPINDKLYSNKVAEMWALMKKWLEDGPVELPDNDILHGQLCSRGCNVDSNNRLVLQPKSELLKSPDEADALAFTFAFPVYNSAEHARIYEQMSSSVAGLI